MVHDLCLSHGLYLLNSVNPYRLEGQKTIGFEAIDQLGAVPDQNRYYRLVMQGISLQYIRD